VLRPAEHAHPPELRHGGVRLATALLWAGATEGPGQEGRPDPGLVPSWTRLPGPTRPLGEAAAQHFCWGPSHQLTGGASQEPA
jgi:hypothetical protein